MNLDNFTPFIPAVIVCAKERLGYTATVLVKAVLGVKAGEVAHPLETQLFPAGDRFLQGDGSEVTSLAYASDFVPYKVNADVLLSATAYRPADRPTGSFTIGVRVGQLTKQLTVAGQRTFKRAIVSSSIVEGEPLPAVPVRYEFAFGGRDFPQNPVGRGHKSDELPLIEYPNQRMQRPGDQPAPAGLAPIPADWEPRKKMIGTFGPDYVEKYWPGFPRDFDPLYFNAAPPDQQVKGYLRGDEEIVLENLHRDQSLFATRLPGWRVICTREDEVGRFELVPLVIDTLWIDPDAEQLVLIWRGRMTVQTPDALEIERLGFLLEELAAPLHDASYYRDRLRTLIEERDADFQLETPEPDAAAQTTDPATGESEVAEEQTSATELAAIRAAAGLPPEEPPAYAEPAPMTPEAQAKYAEIMAQIEAEERRVAEEAEAARWTREKVIAAVNERRSFADVDLSDLDLSGCDFTDADFRGAKLDGVDFSQSQLTRTNFSRCSLQRARFDAANLTEATLDGANLRDASLVEANLTAATLSAADLTSASLDRANLSAVAAEKAVFSGASFASADFSRANLSGAVLTNTTCTKTKFVEAQLNQAACDRSDFTDADFQRAEIRGATFVGGTIVRANFNHVQASDADFTEADVTSASFADANCEGMWLSSAKADGTNFERAVCVDLQMDATSAKGSNFSGCCIASFRGSSRADLSGANFRRVYGTEAVFESCRLDGADFTEADIPGANFNHASLVGAQFVAAELKEARLDHANCKNANFVTANLFQAVLVGTKLNGADVSEGNFYGAEFLDAEISNLRVDKCNLRMTKLEQWAANKNS